MRKKTQPNKFIYHKSAYLQTITQAPVNNLTAIINSPIGLDLATRQHNYTKFGDNKIIVKKFNIIKKIFTSLTELFNLLLIFIASLELALFFFIDHQVLTLVSAIIILFMVCLAVGVDVSQSLQAHKNALLMHQEIENDVYIVNKKINTDSTTNWTELKNNLVTIKQSGLTIGDVLYLTKGDVVPADARIIYLENLLVDQSTLTGESVEIQKALTNQQKNLIDYQNILFGQTIISQGFCFAVVVNVNTNNYSNAIGMIVDQTQPESDYEKQLNKITKLLVCTILITIPLIFLIVWATSGFKFNQIVSPMVFALSIGVALVPEALPAIIAANLKLGGKKIAKNKVIVKNLSVIQNMGSVDVLTTDKTGTLTLDELTIDAIVDINLTSSTWLNQISKISSLASNLVANKIDQAINLSLSELDVVFTKTHQIDFDHQTRVSLTNVVFNNKNLCIVKGSVAEMLMLITNMRCQTKVVPITNKQIEFIKAYDLQQAQLGCKVVLIATTSVPNQNNNNLACLTFEGFICLGEKIKPDVKQMLKTFFDYGIDVKVLTGDSQHVSEKLVDHFRNDLKSLNGGKIDFETQAQVFDAYNLFYRLSPLDKAQLVKYLQTNHVVAFLGDGVNDAGALRQADVGISVNNACGLAKQAADIIMLEKDLNVLEDAFIEGRKTFANAVKYVKITLASNFGLLITLLCATIWFSFISHPTMQFLPISPIQLLLQNLIFDFANLVFVLDKTDHDVIKQPCKWSTKSIIPFALWNGLAHLIISFTNFLIMGYGFNMFAQIKSGDQQVLNQFQTGFFVELILTHIILIIVYRTKKISLIQSRPSMNFTWLLSLFALIPFGLIWLDIKLDKLNLAFMCSTNQWWYLILIGLIVYAWCIAELCKLTYQRIFKAWI